MNIRKSPLLIRLGSLRLTMVCMALAMLLILIGTLAQAKMGTFVAQKIFFDSWWVTTPKFGIALPVFPGGLTVGMLWMVNLVAAFVVQFQLKKKHTGILISHFGVILLLAGQCMTQLMARESHMPIEIGQTRNFSESFRETELALIMTSDPGFDEVISVPYSLFSREGPLPLKGVPFTMVIRKFYPNAELQMARTPAVALATKGMGTRVNVKEIPATNSDDEANQVSAYVEVLEGTKSLGIWLLSSGFGAKQSFTAGGKSYDMSIRLMRSYYPFSLTLKDFRHDRYKGTDIPKNFSSSVHLSNPSNGESRDVLIYMNNPLRYEGKTFYQASFGKDDRLSVFQVVDNPVAWAPYFSCALVILGLALQFLMHLVPFLKRRA
jgi:hypothetical protein